MKLTKTYDARLASALNAVLYTPDTDPDNASGELPLIVYLHGAGERGLVRDHIFRHGIPKLIREGKEINAAVLAPQCPEWAVWDNVVRELKSLIDDAIVLLGIKRDRVSLTGSSMGGFGTWSMGITYPDFFSAIAPVAGGGMSWRASKLGTTPVFAYHGAIDSVVPPVYSELMVNAINASGGHAGLTLLPGFEHNDGIDYAYRNTDLIDKLISARRTVFTAPPEICHDMFR